MIDPCRYCQSQRVAAVLDRRIEESPTPGNKYRKRCLQCERWLAMCSAADFQTADIKHILPRTADPDADDPTVPLSEHDMEASEASLTAADQADQAKAVTDGGESSDSDDTETETATETTDETEGDDGENEFDCPACEEHVTGFPDVCPHCETEYDWPDE